MSCNSAWLVSALDQTGGGGCCCWWQWWLIRVLDQKGSLHPPEKCEISPSSNMYFQYLHFATGFTENPKATQTTKRIGGTLTSGWIWHWRGTASWPQFLQGVPLSTQSGSKYRMTQGIWTWKHPLKLRKRDKKSKDVLEKMIPCCFLNLFD